MMNNKKNIGVDLGQSAKNNRGITSTVIIITIVLIVVIVAVFVAIKSGLFGHAQNATKKGKTPTSGSSTSLDKSFLQVGDYIDYTPDTPDEPYLLASEVSGANPQSIEKDKTLKWRVMKINSDGSVLITSAKPTTSTIYLQGPLGYNNGVLVLNDLCKKQYSNSSLGATARSINLKDIEDEFTSEGITARNACKAGEIPYGGTKEYTEDYSYVPDISDYTGITAEEESKDYYTTPTTETHTQKGTVTLTNTYYGMQSQENYYKDTKFYEVIFKTGTSYWLATRYVMCVSDNPFAGFGVRLVSYGGFGAHFLFGSDLARNYPGNNVRPVVLLGSEIHITGGSGTEDSPRLISK